MLLNDIQSYKDDSIEDIKNRVERCYSLRTFDRFMGIFGFIKIEKEGRSYDVAEFVTKTKLFDKLITCKNPSARKP